MAEPLRGVPAGFHAITPHLVIRGADRAIAFYQKAFGAEVKEKRLGPDGRVLHAVIRIGGSAVILCDEFPEWGVRSPHALGGTPGGLHLYVEDVDTTFAGALEAGASEKMPVRDMFWGDRYGKLIDPFGHEWAVATRREELSDAEVARRAEAFFSRTAVRPHAKAS